MRALRERVARFDRQRVDAIFAVLVIIDLQFESWLDGGIPDSHRLVTAVAAVFFAGPIAVRRRSPSVALLFCLAVVVIQAPLGGYLLEGSLTGDLVPVLVLTYSAGAWLESRRSVVAVMLGLALIVVSAALAGDASASNGGGSIAGGLFYAGLLVIPAWGVGRLVRERNRRAGAFAELAAQAAAEQEHRESAAIVQERTRIGSELQDIIAHSVSAMVIQAGGARRALRSDPERARDSILKVEQTGRETLADLRRLLGMLRKDEDPRALAPQPGLKQLRALIDSMRDIDVECELRTEGRAIDLTLGVDLVAYRVIEAVLHSAAQHRSRSAIVIIRYRPHELELDIRGDGSGPDLDRELEGIVQRVALYDGSLRTLPANGDGFALQARLPVPEAVPA